MCIYEFVFVYVYTYIKICASNVYASVTYV